MENVGFENTCNGAIDLLRIAYEMETLTAEQVESIAHMQASPQTSTAYSNAMFEHRVSLHDVAILQQIAWPDAEMPEAPAITVPTPAPRPST